MKPLSTNVRQRIHELKSSSPAAMVALFDYDGNYLYACPDHLEYLGYQPVELVGRRRLGELIAPEDLEHANLAFMDAVLADTSIEIGISLMKRSGERLRVRAQAWNIIDEQHGAKFMLGRSIPIVY